VFSFLRLNRVYFQKHYNKIPGSPDIVLPSRKKAVFIDGDFWHGWKFKAIASRLPAKYWQHKIQANINRDIRNRKTLRKLGWEVLRIWEHELTKKPEITLAKILYFLKS
jgi:DNA mismatch endonuclease (patch repair protein)